MGLFSLEGKISDDLLTSCQLLPADWASQHEGLREGCQRNRAGLSKKLRSYPGEYPFPISPLLYSKSFDEQMQGLSGSGEWTITSSSKRKRRTIC